MNYRLYIVLVLLLSIPGVLATNHSDVSLTDDTKSWIQQETSEALQISYEGEDLDQLAEELGTGITAETYTVQEGDTYSSIAQSYEGVTAQDLIDRNEYNPRNLPIGEEIVIRENKDISSQSIADKQYDLDDGERQCVLNELPNGNLVEGCYKSQFGEPGYIAGTTCREGTGEERTCSFSRDQCPQGLQEESCEIEIKEATKGAFFLVPGNDYLDIRVITPPEAKENTERTLNRVYLPDGYSKGDWTKRTLVHSYENNTYLLFLKGNEYSGYRLDVDDGEVSTPVTVEGHLNLPENKKVEEIINIPEDMASKAELLLQATDNRQEDNKKYYYAVQTNKIMEDEASPSLQDAKELAIDTIFTFDKTRYKKLMENVTQNRFGFDPIETCQDITSANNICNDINTTKKGTILKRNITISPDKKEDGDALKAISENSDSIELEDLQEYQKELNWQAINLTTEETKLFESLGNIFSKTTHKGQPFAPGITIEFPRIKHDNKELQEMYDGAVVLKKTAVQKLMRDNGYDNIAVRVNKSRATSVQNYTVNVKINPYLTWRNNVNHYAYKKDGKSYLDRQGYFNLRTSTLVEAITSQAADAPIPVNLNRSFLSSEERMITQPKSRVIAIGDFSFRTTDTGYDRFYSEVLNAPIGQQAEQLPGQVTEGIQGDYAILNVHIPNVESSGQNSKETVLTRSNKLQVIPYLDDEKRSVDHEPTANERICNLGVSKKISAQVRQGKTYKSLRVEQDENCRYSVYGLSELDKDVKDLVLRLTLSETDKLSNEETTYDVERIFPLVENVEQRTYNVLQGYVHPHTFNITTNTEEETRCVANSCEEDKCVSQGGRYFNQEKVGTSCEGADLRKPENPVTNDGMTCCIATGQNCGGKDQPMCSYGCEDGLSMCAENKDGNVTYMCRESCGESETSAEEKNVDTLTVSNNRVNAPVIEDIDVEGQDQDVEKSIGPNNDIPFDISFELSNYDSFFGLEYEVLLEDGKNVRTVLSKNYLPSDLSDLGQSNTLKIEGQSLSATDTFRLSPMDLGKYDVRLDVSHTMLGDFTFAETQKVWNGGETELTLKPNDNYRRQIASRLNDTISDEEREQLLGEEELQEEGISINYSEEDLLQALKTIREAREEYMSGSKTDSDVNNYYEKIKPILIEISDNPSAPGILTSADIETKRNIVEAFNALVTEQLAKNNIKEWYDSIKTVEQTAKTFYNSREGAIEGGLRAAAEYFGADVGHANSDEKFLKEDIRKNIFQLRRMAEESLPPSIYESIASSTRRSNLPGEGGVMLDNESLRLGPSNLNIDPQTEDPAKGFQHLIASQNDLTNPRETLRRNMDYLAYARNYFCSGRISPQGRIYEEDINDLFQTHLEVGDNRKSGFAITNAITSSKGERLEACAVIRDKMADILRKDQLIYKDYNTDSSIDEYMDRRKGYLERFNEKLENQRNWETVSDVVAWGTVGFTTGAGFASLASRTLPALARIGTQAIGQTATRITGGTAITGLLGMGGYAAYNDYSNVMECYDQASIKTQKWEEKYGDLGIERTAGLGRSCTGDLAVNIAFWGGEAVGGSAMLRPNTRSFTTWAKDAWEKSQRIGRNLKDDLFDRGRTVGSKGRRADAESSNQGSSSGADEGSSNQGSSNQGSSGQSSSSSSGTSQTADDAMNSKVSDLFEDGAGPVGVSFREKSRGVAYAVTDEGEGRVNQMAQLVEDYDIEEDNLDNLWQGLKMVSRHAKKKASSTDVRENADDIIKNIDQIMRQFNNDIASSDRVKEAISKDVEDLKNLIRRYEEGDVEVDDFVDILASRRNMFNSDEVRDQVRSTIGKAQSTKTEGFKSTGAVSYRTGAGASHSKLSHQFNEDALNVNQEEGWVLLADGASGHGDNQGTSEFTDWFVRDEVGNKISRLVDDIGVDDPIKLRKEIENLDLGIPPVEGDYQAVFSFMKVVDDNLIVFRVGDIEPRILKNGELRMADARLNGVGLPIEPHRYADDLDKFPEVDNIEEPNIVDVFGYDEPDIPGGSVFNTVNPEKIATRGSMVDGDGGRLSVVKVSEGDKIVLSSDGLSDLNSESEIADILRTADNPSEVEQELLELHDTLRRNGASDDDDLAVASVFVE